MSEKLAGLRARFEKTTSEKAKSTGGHVIAGPDNWPIGNHLFADLLAVVEEQSVEIERLKEITRPYTAEQSRRNTTLSNDSEGQR